MNFKNIDSSKILGIIVTGLGIIGGLLSAKLTSVNNEKIKNEILETVRKEMK